MIALDASVLIAHLDHTDAHHGAASRLLDEVATEPLIAHGLTIAEVLVGGVRLNRGAEMRTDLEDIGVRLATPDDDEPLRLAGFRVATGFGPPACCVLDVAVKQEAALATFDDGLASAARRLNVRLVPSR